MLFAGRLFNPSLTLTIAGQGVLFQDGEGLRVSFDVSRSINLTPDACRVQVWNLAEARRLAMGALFASSGTAPLVLAAGYDGMNVGMFMGDVRRLQTSKRSGPDIITVADADDGGQALDKDLVALSLPAGMPSSTFWTVQQAVELAMAVAGLAPGPSTVAALAGHVSAPHAFVGLSTVQTLLEQAARTLQVRFFMRDGLLHCVGRTIPPDKGLAVIVSPDHLMSDIEVDGSGVTYWTQMLDPNIVPGRWVNCLGVEYEVQSTVQRGDTHAGPWSVRVSARIPGVPPL